MLLANFGCGCLRNSPKHIFKIGRYIDKKTYLVRSLLPVAYLHAQQPYQGTSNKQHLNTPNRWRIEKKISEKYPLVNLLSKRQLSEGKTQQQNDSKILTIPNVLTGLRLLAAPYVGYLVFCQDFNWALGLFFLAAVTDVVDGWIARNVKGQRSILGSYIDPLADKILISILTFSLTYVNIIPIPLCAMIIMRDVMIMSSAAHFHYKHLQPPKTLERFFDFENSKVQMEPTQISKYNTFLQLGLVAFSLAAPVVGVVDHPILQAYWYLVASTTVLSGLSYVVKDKSAYFVK